MANKIQRLPRQDPPGDYREWASGHEFPKRSTAPGNTVDSPGGAQVLEGKGWADRQAFYDGPNAATCETCLYD